MTLIPLLFAAYTLLRPPHVDLLIITAGLLAVAMCKSLGLQAKRIRAPKALWPGLAIGSAVVMTFHQAAGYFDTGAFGDSMPALLASYRMFGFHPNWRTVLFSTIMMVVLITWPRKFPRLSKTLPAGFVGIVLTTALNFALNPVAARSVVPELLPQWLPFFHRMPTSVLAMLLIFTAWEHIPYARVGVLLRERKPLELLFLCALIGVTFWFGVLWGLAGAGLLCALWRLRGTRQRGA